MRTLRLQKPSVLRCASLWSRSSLCDDWDATGRGRPCHQSKVGWAPRAGACLEDPACPGGEGARRHRRRSSGRPVRAGRDHHACSRTWTWSAKPARAKRRARSARSAAPDVVLMDLRLPGLSGVDAIRTIRETAPDVRVHRADDLRGRRGHPPGARGGRAGVPAQGHVARRRDGGDPEGAFGRPRHSAVGLEDARRAAARSRSSALARSKCWS